MKKSAGAIIWGLFILLLSLYVVSRTVKGSIVDTGLLALFPSSEQDPLLKKASSVLSERTSHLLVFLVGDSDPTVAREGGQQLKQELTESGFVGSFLTDISPEQQKAIYDLYFPYRYQMLSPRERVLLREKASGTSLLKRLYGNLYSPASTSIKSILLRDPLLFFPELVHSWVDALPSESAHQSREGIAFTDSQGISYAFVGVELNIDPFRLSDQDRIMPWLSQLRSKFLKNRPSAHFYMSGVLPFAVAERNRSEREMTLISIGSLMGVTLLIVWIFFSLRPFFVSVLPIAVGFLAAIAATLAVFGKIHIITWAFGTTLIGVAVDYPLNYLAHYRMSPDSWDARRKLREIFPGLLLGALTTVMGYAALSLAPFPGLRQMALFSSVGLAAALVTVVVWLPELLSRPAPLRPEPRVLAWGRKLLMKGRERAKGGMGLKSWTVLLVLSVVSGGGLLRLRFDDDLRRLQRPPEALAKEDTFVQHALNGQQGPRFLLVQGSNVENVLIRQEKLQEDLLHLKKKGQLTSVQSLTSFLPSQQRQDHDFRLVQSAILPQADFYRRKFKEVGFPAVVADDLFNSLKQSPRAFSLQDWLQSPASDKLRSLWIGVIGNTVVSAVMIRGLESPETLASLLAANPGVRYFDQLGEYARLLTGVRRQSVRLMAIAYLGVWLLMIVRYGFKTGTWVTAPSVAAVLLVFSAFGWARVSLNLIHCLSALLILSMGIDYSIYFAECARREGPAGATLLAVGLCAATTLLSFGFLALCQTPILSSIGITVFFGIFLAFVFSPLPYVLKSSNGIAHD